MGRLITLTGGDGPVNEGERRTVLALMERLPDNYTIVPNAELTEQGSQSFEYDVIVVAPHAVYVIEVKDWHGDIIGDRHEWLLNGKTRKSPLVLTNRKARVLKSYLAQAIPALARVWVEALVCLTATPTTLNLSPEVASRTFLLDDLIPFVMHPEGVHKYPQAIADLQNTIVQTLGARLHKRSGPLRFGQYEVIDTLEHNGDETLYRARRHDMPAAPEVRLRVITLSPFVLSPQQISERRESLMRDTQAFLRMGAHPNIIAARDVFEDEDRNQVVLVLDGTEGRSLRQRLLDGTPMTVEERLDVLVAVCRALVHAHSHGVIHRHVEPAAILIGDDDIPRLADFSLAKLLVPGTATVWNEETTAAVDLRYVAPELQQPAYGLPSAASDLYSLGCIAFELFSGAPPFASAAEAFTHTPTMPDDAPERLRSLCHHLLQGDPALRTSDSKGVLAALEESRGYTGLPRVSGPKDTYVPGDIIDGSFEVRAVLGGGGFSKVYRVYLAMEDREYALKVFNTAVDYEKVQREISTLRKVKSPHIVEAVWASQTRTGQWYLVTQLVQGDTLEDYAKGKKRLAPSEAVEVTCQLLEALETIHPNHHRIGELRRLNDSGEMTLDEMYELRRLETEGIVHRDIKPQNLILSDHGIVLIDFNIASQVGQQVLTQSGTPPYQSPDVQAGVDRWAPSSDLFAVGVVLYELLCYKHPYENAQPRMDREPRDPRDYREDLSPEMAAYLVKSCMPWHGDRFASATEMREALRSISRLTVPRAEAQRGKLSERLRLLLAGAPPNVNPMVQEFLSLSSQARRSNKGTRGMDDVAAATYVTTLLDEQLTQSVLRGEHRLVIITGNAGDGKTAFIQQVEDEAMRNGATRESKTPNGSTLRYQGRRILTVYDGSQDEDGRSSDDILHAFFQPFATGALDDNSTRIAAINEGRLRDFLLVHRGEYADFATYVISTLDAPSEGQQAFGTVVVNLNARSVTAGGSKSIFSRQLQAVVNGPFWAPCDVCSYRMRCPIKYNVDTFRDTTSGPAVTERFRTLVDLVRLRRQRHLTMRDARSLISHVLFRDRTCQDIGTALNQDDPFAILDLTYFQGISGGGLEQGAVLERGAALLAEIDVALVANPEEDRRIAQGRAPRRMSFPDRAGDYPHTLVEQARLLAGIGYAADVKLARQVHEAARREVFFERADDRWWSMLPYQRLHTFAQAIEDDDGTGARVTLLSELIRAISMYEGITSPERAGQALWLATNDRVVGEFRSYRRFPREEFTLRVASAATPFVEAESDRLQLVHTPSGAKLDLDIDLLEILDRLNDGYVPAATSDRGFLVNLLLFKHQLLAQRTTELLLTLGDDEIVRIAIGAAQGSVALTKEHS